MVRIFMSADPDGEGKAARSNLRLSDFRHIFGLRPFWSIGDLKFNFLPLEQRFVSVTGYRAVMNKNILFTGLFDKAVAFRVVEPFDHTYRFRHHK